MEKKNPRPMTLFDEQTIPSELHTLKLLLPYTPASLRQTFAILIRVLELKHTIYYFQHFRDFTTHIEVSASSSPLHMMEELSPYLSPEEANMLETFRNMMNIMEMVQMMQTFTDSTDTENPSESGSLHFDIETLLPLFQAMSMNPKEGNLSDLLMGMLSPEQKETFEMYQTMFSSQEESATENSASNKLDSEESNEV
ncbi:MAG: hypothetical protein HFH24_02470 [Ruminococcus sp.]|nr:hypothetical protein [Ruminococcus sp.]